LQTELTEEKSLHSQKTPRWAQQITKEKNRYFECCTKLLYAGPISARNILADLRPNPARHEKPGPSYNLGTKPFPLTFASCVHLFLVCVTDPNVALSMTTFILLW